MEILMTKIVIFTTFLGLILGFTHRNEYINIATIENTNFDTIPSNLAIYGAQVFKENKCQRCHKLTTDGKKRLISLDGVGGKYPASWFYNLLIDPKAMIPKTRMPSFASLFDKALDNSKFEAMLVMKDKSDWTQTVDSKWEQLNLEVDKLKTSIKQDLNGKGEELSSEGLALIAYLQSIPTSPLLVAQYEKENLLREIELAKHEVEFQKVLNKEPSVITDIANKPLKSDMKIGKKLYIENCGVCHGQEGQGTIGPNLTDDYWIDGNDSYSIAKSIIVGKPEYGMLAFRNQLNPQEIGQITAYLRSIKETNHPDGKAGQEKRIE
ncbi:MAG: c-type cytochrome [Saprospiraceae bacterium]|nr:c-type cytochrome [Saprospiraceae bacterium]